MQQSIGDLHLLLRQQLPAIHVHFEYWEREERYSPALQYVLCDTYHDFSLAV